MAQLILADKAYVKRITNICKKAGIEIDGIVPITLAERNLVLDNNEINDNVMILDIGAGNTDIGVFKGNSFVYTNTLPLAALMAFSIVLISLGISAIQVSPLSFNAG
jgi:cell division protein FtsA